MNPLNNTLIEPRRVLLVEDNEDDYLIVRDLFSDITTTAFELQWVDNYHDARELLARDPYDVCLVDYRLREATGVDLVREFAAIETPFILLTGSADYEVDVEAARAGATDYLIKGDTDAALLERSVRYAIERKKTEAALLQSQHAAQAAADSLKATEARYRRLFEAAQDGILILDAVTGEIEDVNPYLCQLLGYGLDDFLNKPLWEIAAFGNIAPNEDDFRVLQAKNYIHYDFLSLKTKNGRRISIEFVSKVYAVGGRHVIQCNLRDITQRRQAEERLRQSEARLAKSQEMAHLGSWELDLSNLDDINANLLHWSDETFRILGYTPEEFEPTNEAFFRAVHPDDRAALSQAMAEAVTGGKPYSVEHRVVFSDGRERIIHAEAEMVYDESGQPLKIVGLGQDITERKLTETALYEREEFQRTLIENFPNGSVNVFDRDLRYVLSAGHGLEQIGVAPPQLVGKSLYNLFPPEQVALVKPYYEAAFGGQTVEFVLPLDERFYNICAAPLRDRDGEIFNIIAVAQDITERKRAEEAVEAKSREIVTIWESMTDGFFSLDTEWRFTHINPQATLLVQKSREELIGVSIWDAFPESVNTTVAYTEYHRAMREQIPVHFEDFSQRLGKSFEVHAYPSSIGLSVYFRDISERKQAEERIRYLTTSAKCLLWSADVIEASDGTQAWTFTYLDEDVAQRYFPLDVPEGMSYSTAAHLSREPGDRDRTDGNGPECLRRGEDYTQEFRLRGPDGQLRWQREDVHVETIAPGKWRLVGVGIDITSQKDAEAQLIFQKTLLEAQAESSPDGILAVSDDGQVLSYNQRYVQMWDIPAEVVASGDNEQFRQAVLNRVVNPQQVLDSAQYLYAHRDERGSEEIRLLDGRVFTRDSAPITSTSGAYYGRVWYFRDITERKQAEETLRRSEERYRSLALATTQIVWVADANGVMEGMSAWREFTGQHSEEVRGWDWIEAIHPDDRDPMLTMWVRSLDTASLFETEYRIRAANGEYRLFAVRGVPVLERDGSVREWVGTCTDIQDRRAAEEDIDRFFTLSLDMLCIAGLDGYFKRVNPAFMGTLGFTEAEILATPFLEQSHPDDLEATMEVVKTLSEANPVIGFENRYRTKDGSWKWLEWRSVAVPEKGLLYAAARDVTQRKESEAALRQLSDELEVRVEERTAELQLEIAERERAEAKVRAQARQHEAVAELGRRALLDLDLITLLEGAVVLISTTLELNFCAFWKRIPGSDTLREQTGVGLSREMPNPPDKTIGDSTQIGYTALGTVPVISEDLEYETRFQPALYLLGMGITSLITVPVHNGELYGVLAVASPSKQQFSQSEVNFLQTVANVLSSAIARKQAEAENLLLNLHLQEANDELRTNEVRLLKGNQISTELMRLRVRTNEELQEALHQITEAASMMLCIERSSIWLFNENSTVIHCHDLYERSRNRHSSGFELTEGANFFPAIKAQREVMAEDARTNPATSAYWESYLEPNGIASILDVALVVGGKHIGVLCCEHVGELRQWEAEDRIFASAIASVCSLVLESYERARVETDLQASKVEAERAMEEANAANHAKSEFLSRMSHELRTPLNAILGFGQILDKQDLGPLSKESVGYILKGGRHLLDLINEVLDIARVEAGHIDLSLEPIALADIVPEVCALVRPLAADNNIRLNEDIVEMAHCHIMADRQRLKQVLINLLSNAIKYNREGGLVEISCAQRQDGWATIAVRDTGPGIAPQDLPKLFVPFERLSASDSEIEGTGLGLVLSQRLMTAMGGTLEVESVVGQGTTFTIALPEAVSPELRVASSPGLAHPFDTRKESEHTYTVLCIEDNLSNLRLMEVLFQDRPEITLLVAMQASVGLDMARQHEPDLILLDLNLPDLHGKEVLARLQQSALTRDIPVVVISADATPNQIERLLAAGARAYLTKPLDVGQFLHTLDTLLQPARTDTEPFTNNEEAE